MVSTFEIRCSDGGTDIVVEARNGLQLRTHAAVDEVRLDQVWKTAKTVSRCFK
jgi:hypothetical protein